MLTGEYSKGSYQTAGVIIALVGTTLSIIGTLVNNLLLDHTMAMWLWLFSNPILLVWAYGNRHEWWDGGLSLDALIVMYATFSVTNIIGLAH